MSFLNYFWTSGLVVFCAVSVVTSPCCLGPAPSLDDVIGIGSRPSSMAFGYGYTRAAPGQGEAWACRWVSAAGEVCCASAEVGIADLQVLAWRSFTSTKTARSTHSFWAQVLQSQL